MFFPIPPKPNLQKKNESDIETKLEEEEDVFDLLVENNEIKELKEKQGILPPLLRPPIDRSKNVMTSHIKDLKKEICEISEKRKKECSKAEIITKKYNQFFAMIMKMKTKMDESVWDKIVECLDPFELFQIRGVNSFFKKISTKEQLWEKIFKNSFGGLNWDNKKLTWLEKYIFLMKPENHIDLALTIINTEGGEKSDQLKAENLVKPSFQQQWNYGSSNSLSQKRYPYSTKPTKTNNINIIFKLQRPAFIFQASVILPESQYKSPVDSCVVICSEKRFSDSDIEKINFYFDHLLKENVEEVNKKAEKDGAHTVSFSFYDIGKFSKIFDEKERTVTEHCSNPKKSQFVLLKLLSKIGNDPGMDIGGFNVFGIEKLE